MKIGLYNLEPKIVNTAMMQVSKYHRDRGDIVEIYNHSNPKDYDQIYAFSLFTFTDKSKVTENMICGGTGFDVNSKLPIEIRDYNYDWSLYSSCDYSIVWFSRGCIRKCPFCVVRKKEGNIHSVKPKNLNPNGSFIKIMDNNFFANPCWRKAIDQLKEWNQKVEFLGVDARILTEEMCRALLELKHAKTIKIAWDNPKEDLIPRLKEIIKIIKPYRLMCYVLIGYWSTPEEDLYRVEELRKLKIDPFVMPYDKMNPYQKDFSRWVNHKAIFKKVKWEDYKKGKKR